MIISAQIVIYLLLLSFHLINTKQNAIEELQEKNWYEDENGRFKWSFGCDFPKVSVFAEDVAKTRVKESSTCPNICYEDNRCTHFIYTNGYCYLKSLKVVDASPKAAIQNNAGGLCGFIVERRDVVKDWVVVNDGMARSSTHCNYPNYLFTIYSETKFMFEKSKCASHCLSIKSCTHFVWNLNVCWVKDHRGAPVVQTDDEGISLCGFIPARQSAFTQRASTSSRVSSKGNIDYQINNQITLSPRAAAFALINNQQQQQFNTMRQRPKTKTTIAPKQRVLLWNDEFSIDLKSNKNWNHIVGATSVGFQYFSDSHNNSYIENGILYIKPTLTVDRYGDDFLKKGYLDLIEEGCDPKALDKKCIISSKHSDDIINPIASATITTEKSFNFTFGTVEIRAKMPKGDWISTGISLLPLNNAYGQWPLSGEIELLRVNSNRKMNCSSIIFGRHRATSSIHLGPSTDSDHFSFLTSTNLNDQSPDLSADFHIFRMEWTPDGFKFFVDGKMTDAKLNIPEEGLWKLVVGRDKGKERDHPWSTGSKIAPFDKPFYLSVSVSVGGSSLFPDSCEYDRSSGKPWSSTDSKPMQKFWDDIEHWLPTWKASENKNALQIDYIRIYSQ